jgi:hypothetical protein
MSTTTPEFRADAIGRWSDPTEFEVTRERVLAYAAATNDDIPQHAAGELAPPVFAVVPAFGSLGPTALRVIPPELIGMVLHGEQDFFFHRPIVPGMTLVNRAAVIGFQTRSSGVTVAVKIETADNASGEPVCEQYGTTFVRGATRAGRLARSLPRTAFRRSCAAANRLRTSHRPSTGTRRSATPRPPATLCRSTSTTTSRKRWASPGSSSTASAPWPSPRAS